MTAPSPTTPASAPEAEQVGPSHPAHPTRITQKDGVEPSGPLEQSPTPAFTTADRSEPPDSSDQAAAPKPAAGRGDRLGPSHPAISRIERFEQVARHGELTFTDFLNFLSMKMGPEDSDQRKRAREWVELRLAGGMAIDARGEQGLTPLMAACYGGAPEIIGLLLDRGAKVNEQRETGETPLSIAVSGHHIEAARLLIERGADLNDPVGSHRRHSPLMMAAAAGDAQLVKLLLQSGANAALVDGHGRTALFHALRSGCAQCSTSLLDMPGSVGGPDKAGATVLHYAVGYRPSDEPVCRSCGMHLSLPDAKRRAALRADEERDDLARVETLTALLNRGLDVNATTANGEVALLVAASNGLVRCTKALLAAGAGVGVKDASGWSPLLVAASRGDVKMLEALLTAGANHRDKNLMGRTALDLARESGDAEALRLMERR